MMLDSIRKNMTWRALPLASAAAGTAFLITQLLLMGVMLQIGPALSIRYIASLPMGSGVLTDLNPAILVVGVIVHYILSLVFATLIAIVIHRWGLMVGIVGGALLGLALYSINLYTMTLYFPWFFALHSTPLLISHIVFGAVAGGVYEMFDHYDDGIVLKEAA